MGADSARLIPDKAVIWKVLGMLSRPHLAPAAAVLQIVGSALTARTRHLPGPGATAGPGRRSRDDGPQGHRSGLDGGIGPHRQLGESERQPGQLDHAAASHGHSAADHRDGTSASATGQPTVTVTEAPPPPVTTTKAVEPEPYTEPPAEPDPLPSDEQIRIDAANAFDMVNTYWENLFATWVDRAGNPVSWYRPNLYQGDGFYDSTRGGGYTGPEPWTGACCGTACSPTAPDNSRPDPDHPGPQRPYQETTVDTLGKPPIKHACARVDQPDTRSSPNKINKSAGPWIQAKSLTRSVSRSKV